MIDPVNTGLSNSDRVFDGTRLREEEIMVYRPRTKFKIARKTKRCPKCGKIVRMLVRCKVCHKKLR